MRIPKGKSHSPGILVEIKKALMEALNPATKTKVVEVLHSLSLFFPSVCSLMLPLSLSLSDILMLFLSLSLAHFLVVCSSFLLCVSWRTQLDKQSVKEQMMEDMGLELVQNSTWRV